MNGATSLGSWKMVDLDVEQWFRPPPAGSQKKALPPFQVSQFAYQKPHWPQWGQAILMDKKLWLIMQVNCNLGRKKYPSSTFQLFQTMCVVPFAAHINLKSGGSPNKLRESRPVRNGSAAGGKMDNHGTNQRDCKQVRQVFSVQSAAELK